MSEPVVAFVARVREAVAFIAELAMSEIGHDRFPVLLSPVFPGREDRNNHSGPLASRAMRACALSKETPATHARRAARHPQSEAPRSRAGPLDVADGIVSTARARSLYRVALPSHGNVDWPETQCLRAG
jgi:hypothetical protein